MLHIAIAYIVCVLTCDEVSASVAAAIAKAIARRPLRGAVVNTNMTEVSQLYGVARCENIIFFYYRASVTSCIWLDPVLALCSLQGFFIFMRMSLADVL